MAKILRNKGEADRRGFKRGDFLRLGLGALARSRRYRAISGSVTGSYNSVKSPVESTDTRHCKGS